jgi:hypothetical protein
MPYFVADLKQQSIIRPEVAECPDGEKNIPRLALHFHCLTIAAELRFQPLVL